MSEFVSHFQELVTDPAHLAFEVFTTFILEIVILGALWPLAKRRFHKDIDKSHGHEHSSAPTSRKYGKNVLMNKWMREAEERGDTVMVVEPKGFPTRFHDSGVTDTKFPHYADVLFHAGPCGPIGVPGIPHDPEGFRKWQQAQRDEPEQEL